MASTTELASETHRVYTDRGKGEKKGEEVNRIYYLPLRLRHGWFQGSLIPIFELAISGTAATTATTTFNLFPQS